ncbi:MAG: class GN sortase [Candidatus Acidiferrum sp.]
MKGLRILCALMLVGGVCLTGRAVYLHAKAELAGALIRRAWEQSIANSREARAPWPWADTHPVARLRIARLGYDEMVLDHATGRTLAFGPAVMMSGVVPGRRGNLVLAGHRTSWFRDLEGIAAGDRVDIEWFDVRRGGFYERTYSVQMIRVADPSDGSLLAPTAEDALTLITCYPFGVAPGSPQRFVVRAVPVEPSRPAGNPSGEGGGTKRVGRPIGGTNALGG